MLRLALPHAAAVAATRPALSLAARLISSSARTPPQVVSADEAVKHIPSHSRVYVHGAACTPSILLDALAKRDDVTGIEFMHLHLEGPNPCMAYPDRFYSNNLFVGAAERANVAQGKGSYIPLFLSEMGRVMRQGVATPKVALLNVSPPDKHGFVTLGAERRIGQHIAAMVEDGATLQMGIGAVPNAVLAELKNHKHLGIHTEMFSDGVIELIKSGVVDNSQKVYQKGRTVTSFVVGSQASAVTNDPVVIGSNPKVTAINSAVAVDLTGQVAADSVGIYQVSGVGGQIDFERGAAISRGGLPSFACPIVNMLWPGTGVTTTRYHAHYIVTEHGVASLFGQNYHERARRLIAIAHPDHREQLEKEAFERFRIKAWRVL
ncbi:hypothetical protein BCR44DRAFT_1441218 [Catenaria anguillulae PL171]|uniref:Uncharacterized protein n=1 Tax=Catenaria anguillulae PL171 TaxID=765915 RepID=A0A1Y2HG34_9FUNG|nr:hypothetical protein BCR44DRAFT_1441218 [Catenaria anguillulae PL171]